MKVGDLVTYDRSIWLYKDSYPQRTVGVITEVNNWAIEDYDDEPKEKGNIIAVQWCDGSNTIEWAACLKLVEKKGDKKQDAEA